MKNSALLIGVGLLTIAQGVSAQTLDNSKLPKLSEIKPMDAPGVYQPGVDPFVHDWSVSIGYRDSETSDKTRPTVIKEDGYQLGVGFRLGEDWFGRVSGEFTEQKVQSQPLLFPLDLRSDNETNNYTLLLGYSINPALSLTGFYGQGDGNGTYDFPGFLPVAGGSSSDTDRYGVVASLFIPVGGWLTTTSLSYLHSETDQVYPPGNLPPTDSFEVDVYSLSSSGSYALGSGYSALANLAFNHIGSQVVPQGSTVPDKNWFSGGLGLAYQLSLNTSVRLMHQRWFGNSTTGYRTTGLELAYRF